MQEFLLDCVVAPSSAAPVPMEAPRFLLDFCFNDFWSHVIKIEIETVWQWRLLFCHFMDYYFCWSTLTLNIWPLAFNPVQRRSNQGQPSRLLCIESAFWKPNITPQTLMWLMLCICLLILVLCICIRLFRCSTQVRLRDRLSLCAACTHGDLLPFKSPHKLQTGNPCGEPRRHHGPGIFFNQLTSHLLRVLVPARARELPSVAALAVPESHCTF